MLPAPIPLNEDDRLSSLHKMNILSTAREADIDTITRVAQRYFQVETVLVSLVDSERQWFKSRVGLDVLETARDISFCGHAVAGEDMLVVNNALDDERFRDNPLVSGGPNIRFYAGQPLSNQDGHYIGTLCLISPTPRDFGDSDRTMLEDLGHMAEVVIDNRHLSETQRDLINTLEASERDRLLDPLSGLWNRRGLDEFMMRELNSAARDNAPLVIGMVDIDRFKSVNDAYGHSVGDRAIKLAAELLTKVCRINDIVARYGGEEFVLILPKVGTTYIPTVGNKILRQFRSYAKLDTPNGTHGFTVSIGFTTLNPGDCSPETASALLAMADRALYKAKAAGRDRYEFIQATNP